MLHKGAVVATQEGYGDYARDLQGTTREAVMDTQRAVEVTKGLLWLHKGTVVAKQEGCGDFARDLQ